MRAQVGTRPDREFRGPPPGPARTPRAAATTRERPTMANVSTSIGIDASLARLEQLIEA
jgi:hypothetical protein